MKRLISWAVHNSPAMNVLMVACLAVGLASSLTLRREVFPEFALEIVLISVPYPGASPEEVEDGICEKIEEAVRAVAGIKKNTSVAREGAGFVILELDADIEDVDRVVNEIRSEVDRIPSFPELAEDAEIKQLTIRQPAIKIGVIGPQSDLPDAELKLRAVAEKVRTDLLQLKPTPPADGGILAKISHYLRTAGRRTAISQANIAGSRDYQIDVEISEDTLRKYGLTLRQVAQLIRRENIEMPGGTLKSASQDVLLRGKNRRRTGEEIAKLPLIKQSSGVVLSVAELADVRDEFVDKSVVNEIGGEPGLIVSVDRTTTEDLFGITEAVHKYVKEAEMPIGYRLVTWRDSSIDVKDRIDLLTRNGAQGLLLVFLVLAVFLELRLAFWVAMGIPVSVLGACGVLLYTGQTLNMLSMFAFLLALGIVVDDAIVIGENIYAHRQQGKPFFESAIDGAQEVLPSVFASVATTIVAFLPLMFVSGVMGKFIGVMPVAVIAMLIISLLESTFILPCHLAHAQNLFLRTLSFILWPLKPLFWLSRWINKQSARGLNWTIERCYIPALGFALGNPLTIVAIGLAGLLLSFGLVRGGVTPFNIFPKLDSNWINATVAYPDGTPSDVAKAATTRIEQAIREINDEFATPDEPIIRIINRSIGAVSGDGPMGPDTTTTGGHVGLVEVELYPTTERTISSEELLRMWRAKLPVESNFPGVESIKFGTPSFGPGGRPVEFKLLAKREHWDQLQKAVEFSKGKLAEYSGVQDISDDSRPGKLEFHFRIKDSAKAMGVTAADLAETIRSSYFGEEVMRLQRGRHEVKLMVRYPQENRRSLATLRQLRVRTGDGSERPLTELAEIDEVQGVSEFNRIDQLRSITVTADIDERKGNAFQVVSDLRSKGMTQLASLYPDVSVRWEGQQEQSRESILSLFVGLVIALMVMYVLLTLEFRSYLQPLLILSIIPFGFIGAIWGHAFMQIEVTLFSMFGLVALTGVVVNDSIVLIDFINTRVRAGTPIRQSLIEAGRRRLRPVLLTSLTTIAGLLPLLTEPSFQAQVLIPMATSLSFGLMLATFVVLFLVPTAYRIYYFVVVEVFAFSLIEEDETPETGPPASNPTPPPVAQLA